MLGVPGWLKRRGGDVLARTPADVYREYREVEAAYHAGHATVEQLRRARERAQAADLS